MEGILNVTPQELINTATEFQSQGTQVSNLTSEMMSLVTGLSSAWEGDAATAYINRFSQLEDDIQRMVAMITEHTNDLNEMAAVYEQAEQANIETIESLPTDVIV